MFSYSNNNRHIYAFGFGRGLSANNVFHYIILARAKNLNVKQWLRHLNYIEMRFQKNIMTNEHRTERRFLKFGWNEEYWNRLFHM